MLETSTHMLRGGSSGTACVCAGILGSGWIALQLHAINIIFKIIIL